MALRSVVGEGDKEFPCVFNVFIELAAVGPRLTTINEQKNRKQEPIENIHTQTYTSLQK